MKLCIACSILFFVSVASLARAEEPSKVAGHQAKIVHGWTVLISDRLIEQDSAANERALELLAIQLQQIDERVPAAAVQQLKQVPLWFSPEYPNVAPRAEYHPGAGWLRDNKRNPAMEKAVEFTNIRIFERETKRMPNFALHELAHAYHDRVLSKGFGNAEIKAAFEQAKSKGLYDKVEQRFGDGRSANVRAYAITNPMEYFAECTEAFFATNDFFPFSREQLQKHDPIMFALLQSLWGETTNAPAGQPQSNQPESARLSVERIFNSEDFQGDRTPIVKWLAGGSYTTLATTKINKEARDIVRVDPTGNREILVAATGLIPSGAKEPLVIADYELSRDLDLVLI